MSILCEWGCIVFVKCQMPKHLNAYCCHCCRWSMCIYYKLHVLTSTYCLELWLWWVAKVLEWQQLHISAPNRTHTFIVPMGISTYCSRLNCSKALSPRTGTIVERLKTCVEKWMQWLICELFPVFSRAGKCTGIVLAPLESHDTDASPGLPSPQFDDRTKFSSIMSPQFW